jgi:hypothetical protein
VKKYSLIILLHIASVLCFGDEWFVSPDGDDRNPGTRDKPFATITRARDAVRLAKEPPNIYGFQKVYLN